MRLRRGPAWFTPRPAGALRVQARESTPKRATGFAGLRVLDDCVATRLEIAPAPRPTRVVRLITAFVAPSARRCGRREERGTVDAYGVRGSRIRGHDQSRRDVIGM